MQHRGCVREKQRALTTAFQQFRYDTFRPVPYVKRHLQGDLTAGYARKISAYRLVLL